MNDNVQMDAWGLFKLHHAIRLHYTTDYDYFKYKGKTSYKRETFDHRKDKHSYTKMKRIFDYENYKGMEYYIAWLFFDNEKWVTTDDINESHEKFWLNWIEYGKNRVENFARDYQNYANKTPEQIYVMILTGQLHWATIYILDHFIGLIPMLNRQLAGRYTWDLKYKKLLKFKPFYLAHEPIHEMAFRQMMKTTPETVFL